MSGRSKAAWLSLALAALGVALFASRGGADPITASVREAPDQGAAPAARPAMSDRDGSRPAPPAGSPGAAQAEPTTPEAKREHDQVVIEAAHRFAFQAVPEIDGCLGPTPGPRAPHQVVIQFARDEASPVAGEDHFVVAAVVLPPQHGAIVDPNAPVSRCLRLLEGRSLTVPAGHAPAGAEFQHVLTMFLPPSAAR